MTAIDSQFWHFDRECPSSASPFKKEGRQYWDNYSTGQGSGFNTDADTEDEIDYPIFAQSIEPTGYDSESDNEAKEFKSPISRQSGDRTKLSVSYYDHDHASDRFPFSMETIKLPFSIDADFAAYLDAVQYQNELVRTLWDRKPFLNSHFNPKYDKAIEINANLLDIFDIEPSWEKLYEISRETPWEIRVGLLNFIDKIIELHRHRSKIIKRIEHENLICEYSLYVDNILVAKKEKSGPLVIYDSDLYQKCLQIPSKLEIFRLFFFKILQDHGISINQFYEQEIATLSEDAQLCFIENVLALLFNSIEDDHSRVSDPAIYFVNFHYALSTETKRICRDVQKHLGLVGALPPFKETAITEENALSFLMVVKLCDLAAKTLKPRYPNQNLNSPFPSVSTSYPLRYRIGKYLQHSFEAFIMTLDSKKMMSPEAWFNPANWCTERAALHARVVAIQWTASYTLANRISSVAEERIAWVIRANSAGGKTTIISKILTWYLKLGPEQRRAFLKGRLKDQFKKALEAKEWKPSNLTGVLNPDTFKAALKDDPALEATGEPFLDAQVHEEGSVLFKKFLAESNLSSYILDTRLSSVKHLENLVNDLKLKRVSGVILDLDVDLRTSLNRVLLRDPRKDPYPPLEEIKKGFRDSRALRKAVIEKIEAEEQIKQYWLLCTTNQVPAAVKVNGCIKVLKPKEYDRAIKAPTEEEIDKDLSTLITPKYVQEAVTRGDIPEALRRNLEEWIQHPPITIGEAVERRSKGLSPEIRKMTSEPKPSPFHLRVFDVVRKILSSIVFQSSKMMPLVTTALGACSLVAFSIYLLNIRFSYIK